MRSTQAGVNYLYCNAASKAYGGKLHETRKKCPILSRYNILNMKKQEIKGRKEERIKEKKEWEEGRKEAKI